MLQRKTGFLAVMAAVMLCFGGCGTNETTDMLEKDGTNYNAGTEGDTDVTQGGNNLERDSYGMRTDGYDDNGTNGGTALGEDVRNAWDDVKEDVSDMGDANLNPATAKNK